MPLGGNVVTEEEAKIIIRRQEVPGGAASGDSGTGGAAATQSDGSIRENDEDPFVEDVSDSVPWSADEVADNLHSAGRELTDQDVAAMFGSISTLDGQSSAVESDLAAQQDTQQVAPATTTEATPEVTGEVAASNSPVGDSETPEQLADAERDAAFADWMRKFGTIRAAKTADAVLSLALAARTDWSDSQCRELTLRAISAKQEVLAKK